LLSEVMDVGFRSLLLDYKRSIPLILAFVFGILYVFEWYIDIRVGTFSLSSYLESTMLDYFNAMGAMAIGIGAINVYRIHYRNVSRKRLYWQYSLVVLVMLPFMAIISVLGGRYALDPKGAIVPKWIYDNTSVIWNYFYWCVSSVASSMMFALLGFFIISAGYRAFRARNVDAAILLISGFIVLMGNAPINSALFPFFDPIRAWIMDYWNTSAMRAVTLCTAIGAMAYGVRVIFAYERRPTLAGGE